MLERSAGWIDGTDPIALTGLLPAATGIEPLADSVALVESFSNVVAFTTDAGLVLFDVAHELFAPAAIEQLRTWTDQPVDTVVYTHGHVDHVTGAAAFDAHADARGERPIHYVGHEAIVPRFERYRLTAGFNGIINQRQFRLPAPRWPTEFVAPHESYQSTKTVDVGGVEFELHHARGETDDHTWAWCPAHRALCVGDLFIWQFPNAGNPQKVQRYAWDWAVALRHMAALGAELLLPAHGPAVDGAARIATVLSTTAEALESLHDQTLALMNAGARLDQVIHTVRLPAHLADVPYLRPTYDEPEFVVRNLWRLYGGWYDGNPAHLKPARERALASEVAALAGGADKLAARAEALAGSADPEELRLACHLAEMAVLAEPDQPRLHSVRAAVYSTRVTHETSFMATGIFGAAARDSQRRVV